MFDKKLDRESSLVLLYHHSLMADQVLSLCISKQSYSLLKDIHSCIVQA